ncbi:MAG: flagellar basal body L-ring protein FlgH [Phycisphaeraceae bacterium]
MKKLQQFGVWALTGCALVFADAAAAQSSSLYTTSDDEAQRIAEARYGLPNDRSRRHLPDVHPDVPRYTAYVNRRPQPREFLVNDLVTIIVRESFESEMESEKSTEKSSELGGGITQFPRLTLRDLLNLQLNQGTAGEAVVELGFERSHEGEGEYERTESMTGRVRARIIDIKPNGVLVLEARRTVINDGEQSVLVATGNCMPEDITAENTVLSTQLENLFIDKQHSGDLRDSGEKGWLTRLFDAIFDF